MLAKTTEFYIFRVRLVAGKKLRFFSGQQPQILSVIKGRLTSANGDVGRGESVVLPFGGKFTFTATEETLVLLTGGFATSSQQPIGFGGTQSARISGLG